MDWVAFLIGGLYALFFAVCAVLLVYLIVRKRRIRKSENFEKRDN